MMLLVANKVLQIKRKPSELVFGILPRVDVLYNSVFLNFTATTQSFSLLHRHEYNIVS